MSDATIAGILRDSRLAEAIQPTRALRQMDATSRAIDVTGAINATAANPFRTPLVMQWEPTSTARQCTARAGTLVMLRAYASTAPTSGDAVVTITQVTQDGGTESLGSVVIPDETQFSDPDTLSGLPVAVPAGAWIGATVTTANGASGVSISATIEVRT